MSRGREGLQAGADGRWKKMEGGGSWRFVEGDDQRRWRCCDLAAAA